jgi:hypothetical protein
MFGSFHGVSCQCLDCSWSRYNRAERMRRLERYLANHPREYMRRFVTPAPVDDERNIVRGED